MWEFQRFRFYIYIYIERERERESMMYSLLFVTQKLFPSKKIKAYKHNFLSQF